RKIGGGCGCEIAKKSPAIQAHALPVCHFASPARREAVRVVVSNDCIKPGRSRHEKSLKIMAVRPPSRLPAANMSGADSGLTGRRSREGEPWRAPKSTRYRRQNRSF